MTAIFPIGQLLFTPGVLELKDDAFIFQSLARHIRGDWGEVSDEDKVENDNSVDKKLRILSAYKNKKDIKIWIITEADRSTTTVLFPSEY